MHVMVEEHNSMTQTAGFPRSTGGTVKMETYRAERTTSVNAQYYGEQANQNNPE